ncbi:MAG: hypothetical protein ACRCZD_06955 [Phycicoccus sp.]
MSTSRAAAQAVGAKPGGPALSLRYLRRATLWLSVTTLAYFALNGAQIFETATVVPAWTSDPPRSLTVFAGPSGLDFKAFWITAHGVHEVTFLLAVAFTWRVRVVRKWLLTLLLAHVAVRVWTIAYFAPTVIEFQQLAQSGVVEDLADADLEGRAVQWQTLNYLRVGICLAISLGLMPILARVRRIETSVSTASP